jgi:hypothetical protein
MGDTVGCGYGSETKIVVSTLLMLSLSGSSFAAAKNVDGFYSGSKIRMHTACCPSLKDMLDIENGRVPALSHRFVHYLNYHGMAREAWSGLSVELVGSEYGTCVGLDQSLTTVAPWVSFFNP